MTIPIIGSQPKIIGNPGRIQYWPGHPNTHGKNPHKKELYRIIWSESRTYLLGGAWGDNGRVEYRWCPYYGSHKSWVLEKWLSPMEFAGTEQQWDREQLDYGLCAQGIVMYTMGPYPVKGWYDHCYSFPSDAEPNLQLIVPLLESAKNLSLAQIKAGLNLWHERKRKDWDNKVEDGMAEAMPAFHGVASNVAPSKPTADHWSPEEVKKFRGEKPEENKPTPEDMQLPSRGFSIKQRKG